MPAVNSPRGVLPAPSIAPAVLSGAAPVQRCNTALGATVATDIYGLSPYIGGCEMHIPTSVPALPLRGAAAPALT